MATGASQWWEYDARMSSSTLQERADHPGYTFFDTNQSIVDYTFATLTNLMATETTKNMEKILRTFADHSLERDRESLFQLLANQDGRTRQNYFAQLVQSMGGALPDPQNDVETSEGDLVSKLSGISLGAGTSQGSQGGRG